MTNFDIYLFLLIGAVGFGIGIFCIYLVVMRKPGIEAINKGKLPFPFKLGNPLLNRTNFLWFGIVLVVFFGGLIFAIIQENYMK